MSIQWVCSKPSETLFRIRQGLSDVVFESIEAFAQATLKRASDTAEVLVIELDDQNMASGIDFLKDCFSHANYPLTLVLVPEHGAGQASAFLDAGADRCLSTHSDPMLIQAMVKSMLRRWRGHMAAFTEHGLLRFDHATQTLFHRSERIALTQRETLVAGIFLQPHCRYVHHEEIFTLLSAQRNKAIHPGLVSLYIHRINKKILPFGAQIRFKRGYGYRLQLKLLINDEQPIVSWLGTVPTRKPLSTKVNQSWGFHAHA